METKKIEVSKEVKLKYINNNDLKFFKELLLPYSVSGQEHLVTDIIEKKLKELNFSFIVDDIGNIAATRGSINPLLLNKGNIEHCGFAMLNAHKDNVEISSYGGYGYGSYNSYRYSPYENPYGSEEGLSIEDICGIIGDFSQELEFYEELYDAISQCRYYSSEKTKFHKEITAKLLKFLEEMSNYEIELITRDCSKIDIGLTPKEVLDLFLNNKLSKDDTEAIIDSLENLAMDAQSSYEEYDSAMEDYEMSLEGINEEDDNSNLDELKEDTNAYDVKISLVDNKIKGNGKGVNRVLGGDDKCGIFIALKVAEMLPDMPMKILFTVKEEIGCVGINHFVKNNKEFFNDVKYSLTIDRRDKNHLLWKQLGGSSCSDEFAAKLAREGVREGIAVKLENGSLADVVYIRDHVPNSVNMSAGYYDAHTSSEYIVPTDVDNIVGWVKNILTNV